MRRAGFITFGVCILGMLAFECVRPDPRGIYFMTGRAFGERVSRAFPGTFGFYLGEGVAVVLDLPSKDAQAMPSPGRYWVTYINQSYLRRELYELEEAPGSCPDPNTTCYHLYILDYALSVPLGPFQTGMGMVAFMLFSSWYYGFRKRARQRRERGRCTSCGYTLRGLPKLRCPECGTAFDPQRVRNELD